MEQRFSWSSGFATYCYSKSPWHCASSGSISSEALCIPLLAGNQLQKWCFVSCRRINTWKVKRPTIVTVTRGFTAPKISPPHSSRPQLRSKSDETKQTKIKQYSFVFLRVRVTLTPLSSAQLLQLPLGARTSLIIINGDESLLWCSAVQSHWSRRTFQRCPDDGGSTHIWNVSLLKRDYTALYPKTLSYSYSPPWEPEMSHFGWTAGDSHQSGNVRSQRKLFCLARNDWWQRISSELLHLVMQTYWASLYTHRTRSRSLLSQNSEEDRQASQRTELGDRIWQDNRQIAKQWQSWPIKVTCLSKPMSCLSQQDCQPHSSVDCDERATGCPLSWSRALCSDVMMVGREDVFPWTFISLREIPLSNRQETWNGIMEDASWLTFSCLHVAGQGWTQRPFCVTTALLYRIE
jgi:hypothetical protein